MINLSISATSSAILALTVVAVMFVLFVRERYPAEVIAVSGAAVMLFLGILPYDNALEVLSNPAPWTIAAMFVVMGALTRTGALEGVIGYAEQATDKAPMLGIAGLLGFVVMASAFMNNTPVVVMMIPLFVKL
ncbi:SLC13 family permease, partial [Escherichia coli]|nr:SLC13 family permease [Escherichia coli]